MELRQHPLLTYRGLRSWPPVWSPARPRAGKEVLSGELGVLKHTLSNAILGKCYLLIEHENAAYIGCLLCSDQAFCSQIAGVFEDNKGRTIKEIGDLDLAFTL